MATHRKREGKRGVTKTTTTTEKKKSATPKKKKKKSVFVYVVQVNGRCLFLGIVHLLQNKEQRSETQHLVKYSNNKNSKINK
jgi:hypothetical protein